MCVIGCDWLLKFCKLCWIVYVRFVVSLFLLFTSMLSQIQDVFGRLDCQNILIVQFMLLRMFWDVSSCIEFGVVLMCQSLSRFLSLLEVLLCVCIGSGSVFFKTVFVL